jgi:hypothetical protein
VGNIQIADMLVEVSRLVVLVTRQSSGKVITICVGSIEGGSSEGVVICEQDGRIGSGHEDCLVVRSHAL